MRARVLFSLPVLLAACPYVSRDKADDMADPDGDGLTWEEDCDNQDGAIHGRDTFWLDADHDGYGDPSTPVEACAQPEGAVRNDQDCDDRDARNHPGATETCDDADNDCDGETDEEGATGTTTFWADADGDGHGDASSPREACSATTGWVADSTDCDDTEPLRHPGAEETCGDGLDNDCDGTPGSCTALWGTVDVDSAFASLTGAEGATCGQRIADAGDVDADGQADLLATCNGQLRVVLGPIVGEHLLDDAAIATLSTSNGGAPSAAAAGDHDGDGFGDLLLGDLFTGATSETGTAWLLRGPLSGTSATEAIAITAETPDVPARVGWSLDQGAHFGDPLPAVAIGAPTLSVRGLANAGAAYLLQGPLTADVSLMEATFRVYGDLQGILLGTTLSASQDVTGDGLADLVVGAPGAFYTRGGAYVFDGPLTASTPTLTDASTTLRGEDTKDRAANWLDCLGDTNGDGYRDLLVGADAKTRLTPNAGWLVLGPLTPGAFDLSTLATATFLSAEEGDGSGTPLTSAGDTDLDGFGDILAGAPGADLAGTDAGAVWLLHGPLAGEVDLADSPVTLLGSLPGDELAMAAHVGDLDADGLPDFGVAAPASDSTGDDGGALWLFAAEASF